MQKIYKFLANKFFLIAVMLVAGLGLGYWLGRAHVMSQTKELIQSIRPVRENNSTYHFTYPLLGYDFSAVREYLVDQGLGLKLNTYVKQQTDNNNADSVSVYYQNLFTNRRIGINQDAQYHPGSLLKVLIMMAYYREAELDPTILQKTLNYSPDINQQADSLQFALPTELSVGQTYTVASLLESMIEKSDNGAETLLINNVNRGTLNTAYTDLGMQNPDTVNDFTISVAQYGSFLRFLYNSTYLAEIYSEQALAMMSKSTYLDGLSAGVPKGIAVAQKYGERVTATGQTVQAIELHDCGIIYAPNNPYELCIMTKGNDAGKLTGIIKDISGIVYGYVVSNRNN